MPQLSFFADENIKAQVIDWLRLEGFDISGIAMERLFGLDDLDILIKANNEKRVILTQDNDFGKIIYTQKIHFFAVIYLRPGHFDGSFHIQTLQTILKHSAEIKENTIIIGQKNDNKIKVRIRHL